jgi:hypothetical protein
MFAIEIGIAISRYLQSKNRYQFRKYLRLDHEIHEQHENKYPLCCSCISWSKFDGRGIQHFRASLGAPQTREGLL